MTSRRTAWALAALPAAACLSIPPYDPQMKVSYTADGTGATVANTGATGATPRFELHFATGDHFHFPDRLKIDGTTDVLGHDMMAPCFEANDVGIQLSPSSRISGDTVAMAVDPMVKNQLQPVLRGPAVVQVKLDWASPTCDAARKPGGTSTFTVFFDGRIVRHDRLDDSSTMDVNAVDCQCDDPNAPAEYSVSSYWTFDRNVLSSSPTSAIYTAPLFSSRERATPDPLPTEINGQVFACFDDTTYQVASALRIADQNEDPRQFLLRDSAALFTPTHYKLVKQPTLGDFPWDNHSAVFIEHRGCMAAFDRAQEYVADPPSAITVNDTVNDIPVMLSENDGIYGGDAGDGSAPGVKLKADRAKLSGKVASPFAVWLQFPHAVDVLRATFQGSPAPTGAWYIPQQIDSRTWIFWFRDPLADSQTITIAPD